MTGEHELQSMDHEVAMIAQSSRNFLFAAIPVEMCIRDSSITCMLSRTVPFCWGSCRHFCSINMTASILLTSRWKMCIRDRAESAGGGSGGKGDRVSMIFLVYPPEHGIMKIKSCI